NKTRPAVNMTWYDGGNRPSLDYFQDTGFSDLLNDGKIPESGSLIIGDKGKLYSPGDGGAGGHIVGGVDVGEVTYPISPGHWPEFIRAIKGGEPAMSNFPAYAGGLAE